MLCLSRYVLRILATKFKIKIVSTKKRALPTTKTTFTRTNGHLTFPRHHSTANHAAEHHQLPSAFDHHQHYHYQSHPLLPLTTKAQNQKLSTPENH